MKESTLHYLFNSKKLGADFITSENLNLEVIDFGELNKNAGPDFLNAKLKLEDKIWAGHIEFHLKSSDWYKHNHQFDPAYENVIAHFVLEHDQEVESGQYVLPVVELKKMVDLEEVRNYENFINAKSWIPCEAQIKSVSEDIGQRQIEICADERLERKAAEILQLLRDFKGDQLKTILFLVAKTLGGKVNSDAFQSLISKIDIEMLARLNFESNKIQALFHGLSGLLPKNSEDEYVNQLIQEFNFQTNMFNLQALSPKEWKFSSMHPAGNPTFRIMQLGEMAALMTSSSSYNASFLGQLKHVQPNNYWTTHFNFNKETKPKKVQFTEDLLDRIRINVFAPFLWAKAIKERNEDVKKEALLLISNSKAEKNNIISKWKNLGLHPSSAKDSQGLIELKNEYCSRKKCLFCGIGKSLLNK
ncbi:MAG: DUF2851 family protein [Crocinitomicaceae bacterium]